ncbi:AMP-binding protein [Amycolatopsis endophytica]|uniref:Acyl-CoA synthetase (AMP-forming)/AMP-acid ligase II n=1 Tax=Amycolatopsis endophytica TaxID=860233 RepID=A0A853B7Z7_9PSEU|nr:AMP-binding protein [Amycolatopsis endophytica]NYI90915.1 acyl-CoA synthetase (AMP-forming)/AMP-acid ligase II [Amycolatopsis endophytica]
MPDCVTFDLFCDQPRAALWTVLGSPELYPRFFRGVGSVDRLGTRGRHARYRLRLTLSGPPVGHEMRVLLNRPEEQLVLETVPDTGGCLSVRLSDTSAGGTRLKFIYFRPALPSPGRAPSANDLELWAQDGLDRVRRHLTGSAAPLPPDRAPSTRQIANTLIAAGILTPARPDRVVRQLRALAQWGATLAGGYTAAAARSPRGIAVIDEDGTETTFAGLRAEANRLAASLRTVGVGPGGTVAVMARNHSAMVKTLLACAYLGAGSVLLNTGLARPQIGDAIRRHAVRVLVADGEFAEQVAGMPLKAVVLTGADDGPPGQPTLGEIIAEAPEAEFGPPRRPARIVVLTSGTTGAPKGARRPTPKGLGSAVALLSRIPLHTGDRMLMAAPLFHSWGLSALQVGMPLRATLVLQRRFDPEACLRAIQEHRCTTMFAVPVMLQRIMALPEQVRRRYDTSSLRVVASSGSALPASLVTEFMDAFGDVLYNFYGSTEVSAASVATPQDLRAAPSTAGYPPLGTRLAVLGPTGEPVPPGAVGGIFVGNDLLFDGYTDGTSRVTRDELMDTGDRGYLDADGRLFVAGRDDDMIVSGGENVFPRPVEEALTELPGVADVAVLGVPDDEFGQRLVAFVTVEPGARLDPDLVRDYLRRRVARFAVPREVVFVDELPRTPTGKVIKRVLLEDEWAGRAAP